MKKPLDHTQVEEIQLEYSPGFDSERDENNTVPQIKTSTQIHNLLVELIQKGNVSEVFRMISD